MENLNNPYLSYASIPRRILASFLDLMVLIIPMWIASHILPLIGGLLMALLYVPVLESSELRATIGKHWMGIQVTDVSGRRISFRAALIRYFMKIVSSLIAFIGHFFVFFNPRKQALHDMIAETVVVYGRSEAPPLEVWFSSLKNIFSRTSLTVAGAMSASTAAELERLHALHEKGVLTSEEFNREKAKILSRN